MKQKNEIQTAWANAVHNKDNLSYKDPTYGNKIEGKISFESYIAYNIARGLPLDRGYENSERLKSYLVHLKWLDDKKAPDWMLSSTVAKLLYPFAGKLSEETLLENLHEALCIYSSS